jgi:hypothetical protein
MIITLLINICGVLLGIGLASYITVCLVRKQIPVKLRKIKHRD